MPRASRLVVIAVSLAACGPSYSELKVDKIKTVSVAAEDLGVDFCAYKPVPLRVLVTYRDGKQVKSRAAGEGPKGRVRASAFQWSSSPGTIDGDAVLSLPLAVLAWFDEPIRVSARVLARPELVGESTLRPRFDCGGTVDLRGAAGARGGEAEDGGPGAPGPDAEIALAYVETQRSGRLVLVRVDSGTGEREHYLISPHSSENLFVIDARGGAGGRGGQGVSGVDGAPGVDGEVGRDGLQCADGTAGGDGTDGEPGGPGGPGRNGGQGGNGGRVVVRYDARFPELPRLIRVRVEGGEGGEIGAGGAGGRGGRGGQGGRGGTGGRVTGDASGGAGSADCTAADGSSGAAGSPGADGARGPDGQPGVPGDPGGMRESPEDAAELFAEEIERGIPVAVGAP